MDIHSPIHHNQTMKSKVMRPNLSFDVRFSTFKHMHRSPIWRSALSVVWVQDEKKRGGGQSANKTDKLAKTNRKRVMSLKTTIPTLRAALKFSHSLENISPFLSLLSLSLSFFLSSLSLSHTHTSTHSLSFITLMLPLPGVNEIELANPGGWWFFRIVWVRKKELKFLEEFSCCLTATPHLYICRGRHSSEV